LENGITAQNAKRYIVQKKKARERATASLLLRDVLAKKNYPAKFPCSNLPKGERILPVQEKKIQSGGKGIDAIKKGNSR